MNRIRLAMTVFIAAVVTICALGWRWSAVLPPLKRTPDRCVLAVSSVAALFAVAVIWSAKRANRA
ncbi:MAG TPA: hypothetical protein VGG34_11405 [Opitutaceae bacterium]